MSVNSNGIIDNNENTVLIGKQVLESLTKGMYKDPKTIYREYIQNSTDAIDKARKLLGHSEDYKIDVVIDRDNKTISIKDNGIGISTRDAMATLRNVGKSLKDYREQRGFRGLGRLAGLAYAEEVYFITSYYGEAQKTIVHWDCVMMDSLISPLNHDVDSIEDIITRITSESKIEKEEKNLHYFEVKLVNVKDPGNELLDESIIQDYLATVVPVDFDSQKFTYSHDIKDLAAKDGFTILSYNIFFGGRNKKITKLYTQNLSMKKGTEHDLVKSIETHRFVSKSGELLAWAWIAISDFSGALKDPNISGIRIRKQNILIGDNTTFARFFTEKNTANRLFVGEVYALHQDLIPNSQRDYFEDNDIYYEFAQQMTDWAAEINKKYRRGTSEANSAIRKINEETIKLEELEKEISNGVTSETNKQQIQEKLEKCKKTIEENTKKVQKAIDNGTIDKERVETAKITLEKSKQASWQNKKLNEELSNIGYSTEYDLPTSYSKSEKKLYRSIIAIIDKFFEKDETTAIALKKEIINEITKKKNEK